MSARPSAARLGGVLALAIFGISVSGPLARLADAPPLAIAVWRLTLSLVILAVPLLWTGSWREWRTLSRGDVAVALGAGAFLAVHFWSWIASLGMTSVAASVLLVNLHPVVIVAGSALWLHERPTRPQLVGIGLALVGALIVGFGPSLGSALDGSARAVGNDRALRDLTSASTVPSGTAVPNLLGAPEAPSPDALSPEPASRAPESVEGAPASEGAVREAARPRRTWGLPTLPTSTAGNLLAILGALTVGLYYLAGRRLRQRLSLWPYVSLVYGACWVVLLAMAAATSTALWPYAPRELGIFALIALGPMLAGHTGFNWLLKYVPAFVVSVALLAEPVGAGIIAFVWLGERPEAATLLGGAVVLAGLLLGALGVRNPRDGDRQSGVQEPPVPTTAPGGQPPGGS